MAATRIMVAVFKFRGYYRFTSSSERDASNTPALQHTPRMGPERTQWDKHLAAALPVAAGTVTDGGA